jgi:hypothetical protein
MVLLKVAGDAKAGRLAEYSECRSVAVNYDTLARRCRFSRFTLIAKADP